MPAPIDLLYRLTQRDQAFPHWGPTYGFITRQANANSITTTLAEWDASSRPPNGTIMFITGIVCQAVPGTGAIIINSFSMTVRNRQTNAILTRPLMSGARTPAGEADMIERAMDMALPLDRFFLSVDAQFSASAAANQVFINWQGYVMPQGEIGFV